MNKHRILNSGRVSILAASVLIAHHAALVAHEDDPLVDLRPYIVTGTVSSQTVGESIIPVTELSGEQLERLKTHSLGETLENIPGVHSSAFGRGASRPIIRGFDGPRVQVLEDGLAALDVSADSPDHAVTILPEFAQIIDVVKGPATLLYGSSGIGGVVNVIGSRFPRYREVSGLSGKADIHFETVSDGWDVGLVTTLHQDEWAIRAQALWLDHGNYAIPGYAESFYAREHHHHDHDHDHDHDPHHGHDYDPHHDHDPHDELEHGRLLNSFVRNKSASVGWSWFPSEGSRLSAAFHSMHSKYGVPGHFHPHHDDHDHDHDHGHEHDYDHGHGHHHDHDDVMVDLEQWRLDLDAEFRLNHTVLRMVQARLLYAEYEHVELEGHEVATRFDRRGWEGRLEGFLDWNDHQAGRWGLHYAEIDTKARGHEAITPDSSTRDFALFGLEQFELGQLLFNVGARLEHRSLSVAEHENYGKWAESFSFGSRLQLSDPWALALTASLSSRHPNVTELHAHGAHAATRQFLVGDASLGRERSTGLDLGFYHDTATWRTSLNVFWNRFDDYIFAAPDDHYRHGFQVFEYKAVDADFWGFEWQTDYVVFETKDEKLQLTGWMDIVRASLRDSDQNLPRIPPARFGAGVLYTKGAWTLGSDIRHVLKQDRVADYEFPTDSYWRWDASIQYRKALPHGVLKVYVNARNLLNEEIRKHTSFLKDLAPSPGRYLVIGIGYEF